MGERIGETESSRGGLNSFAVPTRVTRQHLGSFMQDIPEVNSSAVNDCCGLVSDCQAL